MEKKSFINYQLSSITIHCPLKDEIHHHNPFFGVYNAHSINNIGRLFKWMVGHKKFHGLTT